MISIVIAATSLVLSLFLAYHQYFRRKSKGYASIVEANYFWPAKTDNDIGFKFEVALLNKGNQPFVVSKILFLYRIKGQNTRRYLEDEGANGENTILVAPKAIVYIKLQFHSSVPEFIRDVCGEDHEAHVQPELLFYVVDDNGAEHYTGCMPIKLIIRNQHLENFEFDPVKVNIVA